MPRREASEKQKQVLRLRASRSAQDDSHEERSAQDDIREGFGETFLLNDRVNQLLLENLDAEVWRAKPVGNGVRTIAAIFSHMHNIRRKWIRLSVPHGPVSPLNQKKVEWATHLPVELDRARCTPKQVSAALKESAQLCAAMLSDERVTQFVRDGWARPWGLAVQADAPSAQKTKTRAGAGSAASLGAAAMLAYMVSHEAHHRGQVCMLAHQMGYRLPMKVMSEMWRWEGLSSF